MKKMQPVTPERTGKILLWKNELNHTEVGFVCWKIVIF